MTALEGQTSLLSRLDPLGRERLPGQGSYGYLGLVKEAKISEIKNGLSRYLALVRKGEVVRILDRDVPVAQIVPITHAAPGVRPGTEALAAMERKGLLRRGSGRIEREILDKDPPGKPCGVLGALLEERDAR
ncbi:MAG: type II toxin-antitoxin system Phd/YefM family antitoxin [Candidatus Binatia bacterium]